MSVRVSIREFSLANPLYRAATVNFYTVDGNGAKTATLATLYDGPSGSDTLANPQTLDSDGKLAQPVYIEAPVIASVSNIVAPDHDTGIIMVPGVWRGNWATATIFYAGEFVVAPAANDYDVYQIDETHTSGTFSTDLAAGKLTLAIDISAISQAAASAGGLRLNFDSTITMADPGAGDIRLDNATLSSVTAIAISALSALSGNSDVSDYIVTWDDGATTADRGTLIIRKANAPQNFAIFTLTGSITDNATWLQLAVTHLASGGSFTAADELVVQFLEKGDTGDVDASAIATSFGFTGAAIISPTALSAATDNWNPTGLADAVVIRASTNDATARNLTGIVAPSPAAVKVKLLQNIGAGNLVLIHDLTSTAANRFYCPNGVDMKLPPNAAVMIVYDSTSSRWCVYGQTLIIGVDVLAYSAAVLFSNVTATLTKGYNATEHDAGTKSSGTFTPDPADGNFQKCVNGGAFTLAPPGSTCSIVIQMTNNASAGAVTTSGFTEVSGESLTTTNGDDFKLFITRVNGFSTLHVRALQ